MDASVNNSAVRDPYSIYLELAQAHNSAASGESHIKTHVSHAEKLSLEAKAWKVRLLTNLLIRESESLSSEVNHAKQEEDKEAGVGLSVDRSGEVESLEKAQNEEIAFQHIILNVYEFFMNRSSKTFKNLESVLKLPAARLKLKIVTENPEEINSNFERIILVIHRYVTVPAYGNLNALKSVLKQPAIQAVLPKILQEQKAAQRSRTN